MTSTVTGFSPCSSRGCRAAYAAGGIDGWLTSEVTYENADKFEEATALSAIDEETDLFLRNAMDSSCDGGGGGGTSHDDLMQLQKAKRLSLTASGDTYRVRTWSREYSLSTEE